MKIGIYDPYMHILGGAERYVLSIANYHKQKAQVTLFVSDATLLSQAAHKFSLDLTGIKTLAWPENKSERNSVLSSFDVLYYVTDGSLFRSSAKKNILIIQSPAHIPQKNLINTFKLFSWRTIICYSTFMKSIIKDRLGQKAEVLFVPIGDAQKMTQQKKNVIISVGRFFPHLHNKKQKEMVSMFREFVKKGIKTELYLVGSVDQGSEEYLKEVKNAAKGLPVEIIVNPSFIELHRLYSMAKVYWHAAGFGEDLEKHPEKAEHFGVATIEAMARGCVPVVFAAGGQKEIVTDGTTGFLWKDQETLLKITQELFQNNTLRTQIAQKARLESEKYTLEHFYEKLHEIIEA